MTVLWMIYVTVVAVLIGAAAGAVDRLAGGRLRQRRWVWALALMLTITIPSVAAIRSLVATEPVRSTDPVGQVSEPEWASTASGARLADLIARADTRSLVRFDMPFLVAWAIAAGLALAAYGVANWSLARRRRCWRSATVDGQAVLLAQGVGPAVVGAVRPQIVVPEWALGLPDDQRALMLEHERQHVRAKDPLLLHAAAIVALLMPWNIAAWWLNRRLRLAIELDCDARVLANGGDPTTYGTLLLNVCSRPGRRGALPSPALVERTSSLTKRILAMYPSRQRFTRWRVATGGAIALGMFIVACEMPSPEMLAPNGKDEASQRLYGKVETAVGPGGISDRQIVEGYFPAIARGEGGPSILFVVKSSVGNVVLTEVQEARDLARVPMRQRTSAAPRESLRPSREAVDVAMKVKEVPGASMVRLRTHDSGTPQSHQDLPRKREASDASPGPVRVRPGGRLLLPRGVTALQPNDIQTVDVTKHAAGSVAPSAVSIITIVLKPGVVVPSASTP